MNIFVSYGVRRTDQEAMPAFIAEFRSGYVGDRAVRLLREDLWTNTDTQAILPADLAVNPYQSVIRHLSDNISL